MRHVEYLEDPDRTLIKEAKARLHSTYDNHDSVLVMFSGGKDSLACLHLAREVQQERGMKGPVEAIFRDFELFTRPLLEYVEKVREEEWVNLRWICMSSMEDTMLKIGAGGGDMGQIVFWDPNREWVRQPPEFAEWVEPGRIFLPDDSDRWMAEEYPGSVVAVTGVRAAESISRLRSVVQRKSINWETTGALTPVTFSKPIYDWKTDDVYRYLYDTIGELPPVYQWLLVTNQGLRTSTVTHRGGAKYLDRLAQIDPELYERVCQVMPELKLQALYWAELDVEGMVEKYGQSYLDVQKWIDDYVTNEEMHDTATRMLEKTLGRAIDYPHAYNPRMVLMHFLHGNLSSEVQPASKGRA